MCRKRIQSSIGVWRTDRYPIGGDFMRVDPLGHEISHTIRNIDPPYKGCNIEVQLINGPRVATNTKYIETID